MPRGYASDAHSAAAALIIALVAGNALGRGGVDFPAILISVAVAVAAVAIASGAGGKPPPYTSDAGREGRPRRAGARHREAARERSGALRLTALGLGLAAATVVVALQLVPLPPGLLRLVSPNTAGLLEESLGGGGQAPALHPAGALLAWRPASLDLGATALELAKSAVFTAVAMAGAFLASSARRRDQMLRGIALSGVAVTCAYLGAALLGFAPLVAPKVTFVNTNHLAGFLQLAAWPALGFALRASGQARAGWLLAFAFTASGVFLSLSRAGIAAFFVAAGIFAVLRIRAGAVMAERPPLPNPLPPLTRGEREIAERTTRGSSRGTTAAVGVSAALAIAAWLALDPIVAELRTVSDESTTALKLGVWPPAIQIAREFPLLGIGRGAFATVYPAYKSEPVQLTFTHVENEWLQLPVDLGIPVSVCIVALFAWAFLAAARRRDLSRPLAGALAGAGAVAAQNLFDFGLEIPGVAIPFALVLGIASRDMPRVEVRPWMVRAGAGVLFVLAAVGLAVHQAHPTDRDAKAIVEAPTADDAIARAREALRWHPADYVSQAAVGAKLVADGRCKEAVPWLTRAMRRNPTAPEPHRAMAWCLARARQDALAKQEYRLAFLYGDGSALKEAHTFYPRAAELLEIAPDTPAGLVAAGYLLRDRPAEAQEAWRRAWESFGDTRALRQLASAKLALGDADEALRLARLLRQTAPQDGAGYVVAARALDALGKGDDAQAELELGASRLPGQAEVLVPLGLRHLGQRRFSQAKSVFESIIAREAPALGRKRVLVARALEGQGRYKEALREAQTAREITPEDLGALETFARIAVAVGRYDEAIGALEIASRTPSAKPGAYEARLRELRAANEEQRARRILQGAAQP